MVNFRNERRSYSTLPFFWSAVHQIGNQNQFRELSPPAISLNGYALNAAEIGLEGWSIPESPTVLAEMKISFEVS